MSGFVGIVSLDGAPVDCDLLWRLTRSLASRGPDAQDTWTHNFVGFGHTLLRTTFAAGHEHQPCTVDRASSTGATGASQLWITADCRVDAREDLIGELAARGCDRARDATDPELILHAYAVWGPDCVHHLLGDFAFAIWDDRARRLFCARDHMGVRQFYYARAGNCLVFSNTLNTLLLHPAVSGRLNELAIADYLVLGANQDPETTSFEDIRRLLPAHRMLWSGDGRPGGELKIERYWELPIDPPIRFRRQRDYPAHFLDLFRTVMRDRLRTDRVGILMSGGLDSAGIAAIAKELAGPGTHISACTIVYDRLIPDRERYFAGLVASHLGIPVEFISRDDDKLFEALHSPGLDRFPDPAFMPSFGEDEALKGSLAAIAAKGIRVALYGEGPDNALHYEWKPWGRYQLGQRHFASLLRDVLAIPFLFRQMPGISRFSRAARKHSESRALDSLQSRPSRLLPLWINPDFAARHKLEERYASLQARPETAPEHPVRPAGYASFGVLPWQHLFERYDTALIGVPVEVRHPYMDIRILRYLLAVPAVPWCRGKYLMRHAFRSYLPPEVVARPKQGLPGFPSWEQWKLTGLRSDLPMHLAANYVNIAALKAATIDSRFSLGEVTRAYVLSFFLARRRSEMR